MARNVTALTTAFISDLQEQLFEKDNSFLQVSSNYSSMAKNEQYKIPNFGLTGSHSMILNPSGAQTSAARNDSHKNVAINTHGVLPISFQYDENMLGNYSLRSTTTNHLVNMLQENLGSHVIAKWADDLSSDQIFDVTGATTSYGTFSRTKITSDDILKVKSEMDLQKVPSEGRTMIIPTQFLSDILQIDELVSLDYVSNPAIPMGTVGRLYGFNIIDRSEAVKYNSGSVLDIYDTDAVDAFGALAFQRDMVSYAAITPKVFIDTDRAEYIGESLLSASILAGASRNRIDDKGVFVLKTDIV